MINYLDNKLRLSVTFLVAGLVLSGCGASGDSSVRSQSSSESNRTNDSLNTGVYIAEEGLTPKQRFSKALEKLENGEDGQALAELNAYLISVPRSNSARNLVAQISTDSNQYFPTEYFVVNLTAGASLSTLAKRYLGSALKFYALAKYNNISNPSRVNIGQEIKIPMTQLARSQRDKYYTSEPGALDNKNVESAVDLAITEQSIKIENNVDVVKEIEESNELSTIEALVTEVAPIAPAETAESALSDLQKLTQNKDFVTAIEKVAILSKFGEFNKESRELAIAAFTGRAKEITETDNVLAATYYAEAGRLHLLEGRIFAAFEDFKMATDLDVQNDQATEEMLALQKEIADKYHREASSAFRRQELDKAIEKWNMVLKVDPDHSSAKLHRAQALDLKAKLDNINRN